MLAQEVLSERGNQVRGGLHDISWPEDQACVPFNFEVPGVVEPMALIRVGVV